MGLIKTFVQSVIAKFAREETAQRQEATPAYAPDPVTGVSGVASEPKLPALLDFFRSTDVKRQEELDRELYRLGLLIEALNLKLSDIERERTSLSSSEPPEFGLAADPHAAFTGEVFAPAPLSHIESLCAKQARRIEEYRRRVKVANQTVMRCIAVGKRAVANRDLQSATTCVETMHQHIALVTEQTIREEAKQFVMSMNELRRNLEREVRERVEELRKREAKAAMERTAMDERERIERAEAEEQILEERRQRTLQFHASIAEREEAERAEAERQSALIASRKPDADAIIRLLAENGVHCFYHITSARNLPLIRQRKGLYSWSYLTSRDMDIPSPGGDERSHNIDRDRGVADFVKLSLKLPLSATPRQHHALPDTEQMVILKIKTSVAKRASTLFSSRVTGTGVPPAGGDMTFIQGLLQSYTPEALSHNLSQIEVMVESCIPSGDILNLDSPEIIDLSNQ